MQYLLLSYCICISNKYYLFFLVHEEALLRFSQDSNNLKKCAAGQNKVKFWLNQPNITKFSDVSTFDCQYVFGDRVEKSVCTDRFPCGICKLPPNKLTLIKGLYCIVFRHCNFSRETGKREICRREISHGENQTRKTGNCQV